MSRARMLVEGDEDVRVLPELLEKAGIAWGPKGDERVRLKPAGSYDQLTEEWIEAQLKDSGLERLAILVDADDHPGARWTSLRGRVSKWFPDFPTHPTPEGVVIDVPPGLLPFSPRLQRFGAWMMPDNQVRGMLETFLLALRPNDEPNMLSHVEQAADQARQIGLAANSPRIFKEVHRDKALIHTWLAWHGRKEPGRQLHQAIKEEILDPRHPYAEPFLAWFRRVYEAP